jgi:TonB-dependent SusC/RagA subfamily outer membrane receptor
VLKDASATAIYGSRASNGVILITTKTGLKGNLQKKSDEIKVFEYSAIEGLNGDVYYKKIGDTIKVTNEPVKVTNIPVKVTNGPVKVTNVPVKVTIVPKIQKNVDPSKNN